MLINKLIIDSTNSITDLCGMGLKYGTDKSPYNRNPTLHKHPYTAVYDFLFSSLRYKEINIAEIGILDNKSMLCWREYFPKAKLYGYEWFDGKIVQALKDGLNDTTYIKMNIQNETSIENALNKANCLFDIVIEDSTHIFEDQIRFANIATKYIAPGGILVIEDIFRKADEQEYSEKLKNLSKFFSSATFVVAEHELKHSPGWDNDKLLILHRNDIEYNNSLLSS